MINIYEFDYDFFEAQASFKIDTEVFTEEIAKATLEFFLWDYDKEADPVQEVMKKYAIEAIRIASANDYNEYGVIDEFENKEGFCSLDGSNGIELLSISGYEFTEEKLSLKIKDA